MKQSTVETIAASLLIAQGLMYFSTSVRVYRNFDFFMFVVLTASGILLFKSADYWRKVEDDNEDKEKSREEKTDG